MECKTIREHIVETVVEFWLLYGQEKKPSVPLCLERIWTILNVFKNTY